MAEPEVKDESQEENQEAQADEFTEKAANMGWVPEDQWKGKPELWRPAKDFVERGENIIPILKDRLEKLEADHKIALQSNKNEIARIKKESYEKATKEYEAKLAELDAKEIAAFQDADTDEFHKVKKERETLKAPEPPKEEAQELINPEFEDWSKKNAWYQEKPDLTAEADAYADVLLKRTPNIPAKELYAKVEKFIKAANPDVFTNPKRDEPSSVEGGSGAPNKGGNKFSDLPDDAKASYTRLAAKFKAQGKTFTKEEFTESYNE